MNEFKDVFKALRALSGMTLDTLAKRMLSHKGYASGIANGKVNPPSVKIVRKIAKAFEPTLKAAGVEASVEDWVELAYVSKAPPLVRERLMHRIRGNPLARMSIEVTPAKAAIAPVPAQMAVSPTPAPPADSDLLPGEKAAS